MCVLVYLSAKPVEVHEITPDSNYVLVVSDGNCYWEPRFELSVVHCIIHVTWFPFDDQRCDLIFESWKLPHDQLRITILDSDILHAYKASDEWDIICTYS